MDIKDYQSKSYMAIQTHANNKEEVMHWAIGLGEEAGEVLSVIKHKYYGGQFDIEDLVAELGDTLWHIAALCTACGLDINDVAEYNIAKLQHRYPDGDFDNVRNLNRHNLEVDFKQSVVRERIMRRVVNNGGNK